MSEQAITIVEQNDTDEIKIFAGDKLVGRYKTKMDAIAHLSTALVELTSASERIAELEAENKIFNDQNEALAADNTHRRRLLQECYEYFAANNLTWLEVAKRVNQEIGCE